MFYAHKVHLYWSDKALIVHLYKVELSVDPNQLAFEKTAGQDPHCFI